MSVALMWFRPFYHLYFLTSREQREYTDSMYPLEGANEQILKASFQKKSLSYAHITLTWRQYQTQTIIPSLVREEAHNKTCVCLAAAMCRGLCSLSQQTRIGLSTVFWIKILCACCTWWITCYLMLSDLLLPGCPGPLACHCCLLTRVRTVEQGGVNLKEAGTHPAAELAWGRTSCVSKHHNYQAERHTSRVGDFSGVSEQWPTLLWWLNFISWPDSDLSSMRRSFLWSSNAGRNDALWNVWALFVSVMRQYSDFITDNQETLWDYYLSLQSILERFKI